MHGQQGLKTSELRLCLHGNSCKNVSTPACGMRQGTLDTKQRLARSLLGSHADSGAGRSHDCSIVHVGSTDMYSGSRLRQLRPLSILRIDTGRLATKLGLLTSPWPGSGRSQQGLYPTSVFMPNDCSTSSGGGGTIAGGGTICVAAACIGPVPVGGPFSRK